MRYDPDLWAVRMKVHIDVCFPCAKSKKYLGAIRVDSGTSDISQVHLEQGRVLTRYLLCFCERRNSGVHLLEGSLPTVSQTLRDLVTVRQDPPRLAPLEQCTRLIASRNPLSCRIAEGQWIRRVHGMYRGDIGFVCNWDPSSNLEVVVAFVPRIPHGTSRQTRCNTGKGKRLS